MSNRCCFFHAVSTLYNHSSIDALDHILSETEDLVAQIQYQRQLEAPFWYALMRDGGTVVHICRNLAGYFGSTPAAMVGRCLWPFLKNAHRAGVQALFSRCAETGEAASDVFPGRYGAQLGATVCRVPWCEDQLGDLVAMAWPLRRESAWAQFAFRSFDGLRISMLLDIRGCILNIDPVIAGRLGSTPRRLIGRRVFAMFPADKAKHRWAAFQNMVWTGQAIEWIETGESGVRYDNYMLPLFDERGQVKQGLVLAREQNRVFAEARPAEMIVID